MADGDNDDPDSKNELESRKGIGWEETCIGLWTRSTVKEVSEGKGSKICNGISWVKLSKDVDPNKVKLSRTRGLQIVVQEVEPREASNQKGQTQDAGNLESSEQPKEVSDSDEMDQLRRRVMDVMLRKGSNLQDNLQHYRSHGFSSTDVWSSIQETASRWQKTSARLISYCKPKEKIYQVYDFVARKVQNLGSRWTSNNDEASKKK